MAYKQIINILIIILIIILILITNKETFIDNNSPNIFISYVYFEKENTKKNLEFFLKHGLKNNMYMIINVKDHKISIDLNKYNKNNNIKIRKTDNVGFDFGGHRDNLKEINFNDYDYFILMNDSCIGPFYKTGNWYDAFINKNKSMVGIHISKKKDYIDSWFLFNDRKAIKKIYGFLNTKSLKTYHDSAMIEKTLSNHINKDYKTTTMIPNAYNIKYDIYNAIFIKENRIGKHNGYRGNRGITNYITVDKLNNEIDSMNNQIIFLAKS